MNAVRRLLCSAWKDDGGQEVRVVLQTSALMAFLVVVVCICTSLMLLRAHRMVYVETLADLIDALLYKRCETLVSTAGDASEVRHRGRAVAMLRGDMSDGARHESEIRLKQLEVRD